MKKVIGLFVIFLLLLNFTALPYYFCLEPVIQTYHYQGLTGNELTEIPAKNRRLDLSQPGLKRKFKIQIWKVWKWREYLTHPRWQLEYFE